MVQRVEHFTRESSWRSRAIRFASEDTNFFGGSSLIDARSGTATGLTTKRCSRLACSPYGYDLNGNAITKNDSTGITSYAWDFENRMTSVTLPGTDGTVSFKYDPFGRRIYKSSSTATGVYAYDGDNLIEETNGSGAVVARYSQGLNIDEPLAMSYAYVANRALNFGDPWGLCHVEMRFSPLGAGLYDHAYLLVTDHNATYYIRGGPEHGHSSGDSSGSSTAGSICTWSEFPGFRERQLGSTLIEKERNRC
jgi:YD repeat-containing protein